MKKGRQEGLEKDDEKERKAIITKERHTMNDKEITDRIMNRAEQNRTELKGTERNRTRQKKPERNSIEQNNTEQKGK